MPCTGGGCVDSGGGDTPATACAITYQAVTVCGLFCTQQTSAGTAFTMKEVEVLTPPSGDYCSCDGLTVGKRTIFVPCACDATDETILAFKEETVYTGFDHSSGGSGSGDNGCYSLTATWTTILTIDCPGCEADSGHDLILEGELCTLVSDVSCDGGCPAWALTQVCVLARGETDQNAGSCDCIDCDVE